MLSVSADCNTPTDYQNKAQKNAKKNATSTFLPPTQNIKMLNFFTTFLNPPRLRSISPPVWGTSLRETKNSKSSILSSPFYLPWKVRSKKGIKVIIFSPFFLFNFSYFFGYTVSREGFCISSQFSVSAVPCFLFAKKKKKGKRRRRWWTKNSQPVTPAVK